MIAVNPSYTSINCSNCGESVVKTLSTTTDSCHTCSYVADRDENAAKNVLKAGLQQLSDTVGRTEIEQEQVLLNNASGENDLCLVVKTQPSKPTH